MTGIINSKITLKVKKHIKPDGVIGNGEITGITELDLHYNEIEFKKLQFTEPGEYTLSIIPDNDVIAPMDFYINVSTKEEKPQEETKLEEVKDGDKPCIAQIFQPSFKLDPIEFVSTENKTDDENFTESLGRTPFIWYNGTQIKIDDVKNIFIYYKDMIPKCQMVIKDTMGLLNSDKGKSLNETTFEVFLNSNSINLKSIHLKFTLEVNQINPNGTNTLTGTLYLRDAYKKKNESYNDTSYNVIKQISKNLQLGFNSNISNTNDSMPWRRSNKNVIEFLNNMVKHSYISDNSFISGYIDFYWCFNYVDLEKEWNRDNTKDVCINSQGIEGGDTSKSDEDRLLPLRLTNDQSMNSTVLFFTINKENNNSSENTNKTGFYTQVRYYDRKKKQYLNFDIDSLSSNPEDVIILKDAPSNYDIDDKYQSSNMGSVNTDNVHPNYSYAVEQNKRNFINLTNITLDVTLPQPNYSLYLYQKVRVDIINPKRTVSDDSKEFDERLSGDWLIIDIQFFWQNGSFSQSLILARKELGKTKEEKETQTVKSNEETIDISENPITGTQTGTQSNIIEEEEDDENMFILTDDQDLSMIEMEREFEGYDEYDLEVLKNINIGTEITYNPPTSYNPVLDGDKNSSTWNKTGTIVKGATVPSDIASPPSYNRFVTINKTIQNEYIPTLNKLSGSKGLKLLATIMAQKEGFYPDTRSYRTNNPGNIGNVDSGKNNPIKSLKDGIQLQFDYIKKVAYGGHSAYPMNKIKKIPPYYSPEIAKNQKTYGISPFLPGYEFTYTGTIEQYVKIYSTGARAGNSYISMIVSWFRQNGYDWVTASTEIRKIIEIN